MDQDQKKDAGKPRLSLVPLEAIDAAVEVLEYGASKYKVDGWRQVEGWRDRYWNALWRHLRAWRRGEDKDSESGLRHLAHALCNVVFLLVLSEYETGPEGDPDKSFLPPETTGESGYGEPIEKWTLTPGKVAWEMGWAIGVDDRAAGINLHRLDPELPRCDRLFKRRYDRVATTEEYRLFIDGYNAGWEGKDKP